MMNYITTEKSFLNKGKTNKKKGNNEMKIEQINQIIKKNNQPFSLNNEEVIKTLKSVQHKLIKLTNGHPNYSIFLNFEIDLKELLKPF